MRLCTYCNASISKNVAITFCDKPDSDYCSVDCMEKDSGEPASDNMKMVARAGGFMFPKPKQGN